MAYWLCQSVFTEDNEAVSTVWNNELAAQAQACSCILEKIRDEVDLSVPSYNDEAHEINDAMAAGDLSVAISLWNNSSMNTDHYTTYFSVYNESLNNTGKPLTLLSSAELGDDKDEDEEAPVTQPSTPVAKDPKAKPKNDATCPACSKMCDSDDDKCWWCGNSLH